MRAAAAFLSTHLTHAGPARRWSEAAGRAFDDTADAELADQARAALDNPEIRRRASLSQDRRRHMNDEAENKSVEDGQSTEKRSQRRLADF